MKERIINWLKADTSIYDESKPEGDPTNSNEITAKLTKIIFGVAEEEHWQNILPPFLSVSNADEFVVADDFFGSVVDDSLTSSYEKIQFDLVLVVQGPTAEITEKQIDYLQSKIVKRIKSNIQLKDVDKDGNLIASTALCATSRRIRTDSFQAPMLNRRLFAYKILIQCEIGAGLPV